MRSLLLLAACVALSGCLGSGEPRSKAEPKSEQTSAPNAETQTAEAGTGQIAGNAAEGPAASTSAVKPASVEAPVVETAAVKTPAVKTAAVKTPAVTPSAVKTSAVKNPMDDRNCYTVDLFTDVNVEKPVEGLHERYTQYLGQWGNGAWNGVWCHDLLVHRIYPDGQVALVDMHAPYEPWNQPATAFRRIGWIDKEGKLHFNYGPEKATYQIVDGKMKGTRLVMGVGTLHIELQRRAKQPKQVESTLRVADATPQTEN